MKKKTIWIAIGIFAGASIIYSLVTGDYKKEPVSVVTTIEKPQINQDSLLRKSFTKYIVDSEKKVADCYLNDAGYLYAAVKPDGTDRKGFAEYLCQVAKDKNVAVNKVKIVDINSVAKAKSPLDWEVIGESYCN